MALQIPIKLILSGQEFHSHPLAIPGQIQYFRDHSHPFVQYTSPHCFTPEEMTEPSLRWFALAGNCWGVMAWIGTTIVYIFALKVPLLEIQNYNLEMEKELGTSEDRSMREWMTAHNRLCELVAFVDGLFRGFILLQFCFLLPSFILAVYLVCSALPVLPDSWQIASLLIVWTLFQIAEVCALSNLPAAIHTAIYAHKPTLYRHLLNLSPASDDFAFLTAFLGRLNSGDIGMSVAGSGLITGSKLISVQECLALSCSFSCERGKFQMMSVIITYTIVIIQMSPPTTQMRLFRHANFTLY